MTKPRLCNYCKFEVPIDAIFCGHCGQQIPFRAEHRHCNKHGLDYEMNVAVQSGVPLKDGTHKCPKCAEEANMELAPLNQRLSECTIEHTRLMNLSAKTQKWHVSDDGSYGETDNRMRFLIFYPAGALIVAVAMYFPLSFPFWPVFLLSYAILFGLCWLAPFIKTGQHKEAMEAKAKEIQQLNSEIRRIKDSD